MSQRALLHQRIVANAGSGKTYRLTTRYIELLARQVPPERIIALTFTRKAAGEFLDAIFARLLAAAEDEERAADLARAVGFPDLTQDDFRGFLRLLVDRLPQLALGTLDGFFGRIVRVFPFECGLAGEISILEPHFQEVSRRAVLAGVFREHASSEKSFNELLELLRRQSRNRQSRSVVSTLDNEVRALHEKFLLTPERITWGDPERVWPGGLPFDGHERIGELVDQFERALFFLHADMEDRHREGWADRLEALRRLKHDVPEKSMTFALRAIDPPPAKKAGYFELKLVNKPFAFPEGQRALVTELGRAIVALDLHTRLDRSRALHHLLAKFEQAYQRAVRDAGRLTFLDITGLLAGADGARWRAGALSEALRQQIDFRLDASYDHWLLDEFQDTSRLQWQAIRQLVDEVIQSDSGRRSFFYVGDTKQAIYSWRGGDPRLFDEIAAYYNSGGEDRIDTAESLATSYRSVPEVLDGVNSLFDPANLQATAADMEFPGEVVERWRSAWRVHQPFRTQTGRGCFSWQTFAIDGTPAAQFLDLQTAQLLTEIDPIRRGWSCAVLVHTNRRITSVVNALRAVGLPAAAEGRFFPCADNEFGTAFLALIRFLAHPDDKLSENHVKMSPLKELFAEGEALFRVRALRKIRADGIAAAGREWLEAFDLPEGSFIRSRAETLLEAAAGFDRTSGRAASLDEFIEFAESFSTTESGSGSAIRVMTVHASKGLDFDVVVLPEIEGSSLPSRRDESSIHLHLGAGGAVRWGMELPPRQVCAADPALCAAYDADVVEDCYENICLYYVALTRARRGLYLLSSRQKEASKSRDFNRLLHLTFSAEDEAFVMGNPAWYLENPAPEISAEQNLRPAGFPRSREARPLIPRAETPSSSESSGFPMGALFEGSTAASLGAEVHAILANIGWLEEGEPDLASFAPEAVRLARDFYLSPAGRALFSRPPGEAVLWREKAFDVLAGERRISGIFDRVVLREDGIDLIDFKTDQDEPEALLERYRRQMSLYRQSLAFLLRRPPESIRAWIVSVRAARVLELVC